MTHVMGHPENGLAQGAQERLNLSQESSGRR